MFITLGRKKPPFYNSLLYYRICIIILSNIQKTLECAEDIWSIGADLGSAQMKIIETIYLFHFFFLYIYFFFSRDQVIFLSRRSSTNEICSMILDDLQLNLTFSVPSLEF